MIELDNNATTRPEDAVVEAMCDALTRCWHNPSSMHRPGQQARAKVELARQSIARLIGASPKEITLTSGGTEAIHLAIRGALSAIERRSGANQPLVVITTKIEHPAVHLLLESLADRGRIEIRYVPLTPGGAVDIDAFDHLLSKGASLVSLQWANNETGVIQPIPAVGALCTERKILLHCDGCQWVGKEPTQIEQANVDLLSFASHKLHGPKGVGALFIRKGVRLAPQFPGAQELGRRAGTENVPGVVGLGVAADRARAWLADDSGRERLGALRDRLEQGVLEQTPDAIINAPPTGDLSPGRLWNTSSIGFPHMEAEALLMLLSERGVCASAGAACSSGSLEPSKALLAMGVEPHVAHGTIRFSLSRHTTPEEIKQAIPIIAECVKRLRGSLSAVARSERRGRAAERL